MSEQTTLAVLGTGAMGEAVVAGLLAGGWAPERITVTARRPERAAELVARHGVRTAGNREAATADVVVLGVKPGDMAALLAEVEGALPATSLAVSIAAGLPTAFFEARLAPGTPVARVMPNTASAVGEGMSLLCAGSAATPAHLELVEELLAPLGRVARLPEAQVDAATAVSGSGPAYHFLVAEAMTEAAVALGLPRVLARELVAQTAYGAAALLRDSGRTATELREQVTSPGGTTIAALRELEAAGLRTAFFAALEAARDRGQEMGSRYA
ncbi:pyrroline-5-carboxylate reductase [Motilibacter rhizosphaerae]|uniref:Pyrroline-5-carboxylate reductase n=1 Tax=Motilibacter rhizosphaerae TaxID=598652 RepID=A0A4Q7NAH9_9ACTN|nr:pyrroline-5-carboxylate reductase [Motilibacter rhizosphaerae]RZS79481.1 pyrroline-5-carboxylate reductase [Motilibacter rhizosphaerae]